MTFDFDVIARSLPYLRQGFEYTVELTVVAALLPAELAATLRRLRGQGYGVHVLKTSAWEWGDEAAGLPVTELEPTMRILEAQAEAEAVVAGSPR